MKVLLMAYECSPYRGSEWAVGWGRLLQAARVAETHVITGEENFHALEKARAEGLVPANVFFYTPEPDAKLRARDPHAGVFAYHYGAYQHWQQLAFPLAQRLHAEHRFDVVHQVTVNTFREPSYAWRLDAPFVWGPVGGSQNFPLSFLSMIPAKEAAKELVRAVVNHVSLRFKRRVRAAAKKATVIFASNSTNARDYRQAWGRKIECLLETGLAEVSEVDRARFKRRAEGSGEPLQILWSGELQTRKALPVLLRALAKVSVPFQLTVLGDGPMRSLWEKEAAALGLSDRVAFRGRLPFAEAVAAMQQAELFCFTSLRDTSGNVVLEALAAGVPVVCFDHQGAGDMVNLECGVKIAVSSPKQAVKAWADAIERLARDGSELLMLSRATTAQARKFLWSSNGDRVNALYEQLAQRETINT